MTSAIIQGGDILLLITSPNNCLFHFNEQVPVDRNMLVFFFCPLLMINNKLQMNHVASGFSYISFHFFPIISRDC